MREIGGEGGGRERQEEIEKKGEVAKRQRSRGKKDVKRKGGGRERSLPRTLNQAGLKMLLLQMLKTLCLLFHCDCSHTTSAPHLRHFDEG